jgi:hypothetical protein
MSYISGTVTGVGLSGHYQLFEAIRTFCTGTLGWVEMRYDGTTIGKISSITRSGTTATVTTEQTHGQVSGASINISGCSDSLYNGTYSIVVTSTTQFTYVMSGTPAISPAAGTPVGSGSLVDREVIFKAPGSGSEQIYLGIKCYQNVAAGYYNFRINGFTGYLSGNTFNTQPGRISYNIGCPLWAGAIDYELSANGRKLFCAYRISGNDYSFYMGKPLHPGATPQQWPYPIVIAGMLPSDTPTLYSDVTQNSWYKGSRNNLAMRFVDGVWRTPQCLPFQGGDILRNTKSNSNNLEITEPGYWGLHSIYLSENVTGYVNNYGELEDVYYISGFSNTSGNTLTIGADTYKVIGDINRTGNKDYIAFKQA